MKPKNKTLQHLCFIALAFAGLSPFGTQSAQAATITWDNTATDFNTNTSWTGSVLPGSGDNATFSSAVTNQPDLSANFGPIQGLTFSTATGGWNLTKTGSAALTLSNVGTGLTSAINSSNTSGTNTVAANLILSGAAASTVTFTQTLGGTLALSGDISSTNAIAALTFIGTASGAAGSTFIVSGTNTYTGQTNIGNNSGIITVVRAASSGAFGSGLVVLPGNAFNGRLELTGGITLANAIYFSGRTSTTTVGIQNISGNNTLSGLIDLQSGGTPHTIQSDAGLLTIGTAGVTAIQTTAGGARTLTLRGAGNGAVVGNIINGSGTAPVVTLVKNDAGTWTLSGANTYTGATTVSGGTLTLNNALALQNSALNTTNSIAGTSTAGLKATVTTLTMGGLTGNKDLASVFTTTSGGYSAVTALTLNPGTGVTNAYSAVIADGAAGMTLTKTGLGTQTLSGTNTYTGVTTVSAGILALGLNGTISDTLVLGAASPATTGSLDVTAQSSFSQTNVSGNGTLNIGAGKTVTVTGSFAPGFSAGTLNVTGDLALAASTSTTLELAGNGGVAGTDSDFVNVSGSMTLDGLLAITSFGGYDLTQNAIYNLFDAASFTGDFDGVSVGGNVLSPASDVWSGTFSGTTYSFSETTGVLTVVPEPSSMLLGGLGLLALLRRHRK